MKIYCNRVALWTTVGVCLMLGGCAKASAETTRSRAHQADRQATRSIVSPLTDAQRARLEQALSPRLSRSTQGLQVMRTASGSHRIDLRGQFQHMSVATRDADGQVSQQCVSTPEELSQLLAHKQERDRRQTGGQP
jgi:hypothetical protein